MKAFVFLLSVLVLLGCCGCGDVNIPSRDTIYDLACEALSGESGVPENAKPAPIDEAVIGIAKNAASVDLPYTYTDADGQTQRATQTLWFKRVARTWTVTKVEPTSNYR